MQNGCSRRRHLTRIPVWLPVDLPVVYFVTVCCAGRRQFFVSPPPVRIAVECLQRTQRRLEWQVHKICLMPDHVHLLLSPLKGREQSLSSFVQGWKSCVTMRLRQSAAGPIWQREFFDRLLRSGEKLQEKWEYVRENPIRAGLCLAAEDYPYSGTTEEILERLP
jgi:REP-associated tyrosine transposase